MQHNPYLLDPERLRQATEAVGETSSSAGIGTLREKTLHAILKHYFEPNPQYHEVKIGRYVVDIVGISGIIEIQTGNLGGMKQKLQRLLAAPNVSSTHPVTVVHPIIRTKRLTWVDPQTGEATAGRRSPKKGSCYDAFRELYALRELLPHPHLHIYILLYDGEELRTLTGWSANRKRGANRVNRIPTALVAGYPLATPCDYEHLLPPDLPMPFTSKDFMKRTRTSPRVAWSGIALLSSLGLLEQVGKQGNAFLYQRTPSKKTKED